MYIDGFPTSFVLVRIHVPSHFEGVYHRWNITILIIPFIDKISETIPITIIVLRGIEFM